MIINYAKNHFEQISWYERNTCKFSKYNFSTRRSSNRHKRLEPMGYAIVFGGLCKFELGTQLVKRYRKMLLWKIQVRGRVD